ncbi:MAG: hypothetical protein IJR94_03090 [Synergistaceae bacterium]|nr:hypothetical protein [Synergistaceae bacterium]
MFDPEKTTSLVWFIAGGYLLYLGDDLLTMFFKNNTDYPVMSLIAGALFVIFGGTLLFFGWKKWKAQEKKDNDNEGSNK